MILVSSIRSSFTTSVKFFATKTCFFLKSLFPYWWHPHSPTGNNVHSGELPVSYFLKQTAENSLLLFIILKCLTKSATSSSVISVARSLS